MAASARYRALEQAGLLHPAADAVVGEPFRAHPEFFASFDKVQVKYEMLRAHVVDGQSATAAADSHGYSRASFYLVQAAFERSGMVGLLDERPGRNSPPSWRRRWGSGFTAARSKRRWGGAGERAVLADRRAGTGRL